MRVLVTGANGFVGRHLVVELSGAGHEVIEHDAHIADLRDAAAMDKFVGSTHPDGCIHLAGIAFVPKGWSDPQLVFAVNVEGTVNLLESFRRHAPAARFVYVSSAQVYGNEIRPVPTSESDAMEPDNLYAVSKMTADLTCLLYAKRYGMPVTSARPCNHIGPGQSADFVVPAFARQIADIKAGKRAPLMRVGNLDSEREFADVRDVARAYRLILEKGTAGHAYNIATGRFVKIGFILDTLAKSAGVQPKLEVDPKLFRPTDTQPRLDASRIERDTGWKPQRKLEDTLRDILQAL